jgi:hypothetical protein
MQTILKTISPLMVTLVYTYLNIQIIQMIIIYLNMGNLIKEKIEYNNIFLKKNKKT